MTYQHLLKIISFLLLFSPMSILAQKKQQRVAIFKNGTGFFFQPKTVKSEGGKFLIKNPPAALFGTLWFYTNNKPLKSLKSYESKEDTEPKSATNLIELLHANTGKSVIVYLENDNEVEGKIEKVIKETILIRTDDGVTAIQSSTIKTIDFSDAANLNYEYADTEKRRIVELEIQNAGKEENIEMAYLQRGIGWLPSYLVHLKSDTKAQIVLRAEVVNDAQDIENATLSLVVGVPSFKYDNLPSPFVSGLSLEQFLNRLNGSSGYARNNRQVLSNAIVTQSARYESYDDVATGGGAVQDMSTGSQEDLFFYTQKGISLPKGGRALYSLFMEDIDYKHLYEVELRPNNGYNVVYRNEDDQKNDVYHSLELKNSTAYPWTTGTAMVTKSSEGQPEVLSQNMIRYTAKSAKSMLRLTIAPDVMVKDSEKETDRKANIKQKGIVYDLVTATGTIEVKNYKEKSIDLKISRKVIGEMLSSNIDWNVEKKPNYYRAANQTNEVSWSLKLKTGVSRTITYTYQFYVKK